MASAVNVRLPFARSRAAADTGSHVDVDTTELSEPLVMVDPVKQKAESCRPDGASGR